MIRSVGAESLQVAMAPLPSASPLHVLSHFADEPRGFWSRGRRWIAHGGVAAEIAVGHGADGFGAVRARIGEAPGLRWFGGFAFDSRSGSSEPWAPFGAARFHAPRVIVESADEHTWLQVTLPAETPRERALDAVSRWQERLAGPAPHAPIPGPPTGSVRVPAGDREGWLRMVARALDAIREGRLEKVVLARSLPVHGADSPLPVLARLLAANPDAWTFLFEPEVGAAFLGASPESLAVVDGTGLSATAVAGSRPRGTDSASDAELGDELLASDKDRREHDLVVRRMAERLAGLVRPGGGPPETRLLSLSGIHHLEAVFRGELQPGVTVMDVLEALHPTPAVCGSPREAARAFLLAEEGFDRGWYGGPVGWVDGEGSGVFVPALRCALLHDRVWRLFAGAGIVRGSDPVHEWEETRLKLRTALEALDGGR